MATLAWGFEADEIGETIDDAFDDDGDEEDEDDE